MCVCVGDCEVNNFCRPVCVWADWVIFRNEIQWMKKSETKKIVKKNSSVKSDKSCGTLVWINILKRSFSFYWSQTGKKNKKLKKIRRTKVDKNRKKSSVVIQRQIISVLINWEEVKKKLIFKTKVRASLPFNKTGAEKKKFFLQSCCWFFFCYPSRTKQWSHQLRSEIEGARERRKKRDLNFVIVSLFQIYYV